MFKNLIKREDKIDKTKTSIFYFGKLGAEGDTVLDSKLPLEEVFVDPMGVLNKLSNESKFLIIGRKGAGKSAFAQYIHKAQEKNSLIFSDFVTRSQINLEFITSKLEKVDTKVSYEIIYKWIIYTKILKLILKDNSIMTRIPSLSSLDKFFKKNNNIVSLDNFKIDSIKSTDDYSIKWEYLSRFALESKMSNEINKKPKSIVDLIEDLESILRFVLEKKDISESTFSVFFDDLDQDFTLNNSANVQSLLNLIRITREININFLGRLYPNARVILLLREDVSDYLITRVSGVGDTAKIFKDYSIRLNWYEKTNQYLYDFAKERIIYNFKSNNIPYNPFYPWDSLFDKNDFNNGAKDCFKYVLDHTFYRPRDIVHFLKIIADSNVSYPVKRYDINNALGRYVQEIREEIKNELGCKYTTEEVDNIFDFFKKISKLKTISYGEALSILSEYKFQESNPVKILEDLFDYSYIYNIDSEGLFYIKYREGQVESQKYTLNSEHKISSHRTISLFYDL